MVSLEEQLERLKRDLEWQITFIHGDFDWVHFYDTVEIAKKIDKKLEQMKG